VSFILRDARIIDGLGDIQARGFIVIEGNRIVEVGKGAGPSKKTGHEAIDLDGRCVLPGMIDRGGGAVINVASVAAFSPFSGAMYSGTKAFLVMFSENLQAEVRSKGIVVQALCPGMTHTEFHQVAEIDKAIVPKPFWMPAEKVVGISLRRLGRGVVCITGWHNKIIAFLMRCPVTAAGVRAIGRSRGVRRRAGED